MTDTFVTVSADQGAVFQSSVVVGDLVYGIPKAADNVLVVDAIDNDIQLLGPAEGCSGNQDECGSGTVQFNTAECSEAQSNKRKPKTNKLFYSIE